MKLIDVAVCGVKFGFDISDHGVLETERLRSPLRSSAVLTSVDGHVFTLIFN